MPASGSLRVDSNDMVQSVEADVRKASGVQEAMEGQNDETRAFVMKLGLCQTSASLPMSTSSSPGSSRSASPENGQDDKAAAARLAQLEAMLSASMGYAFDEDAPMAEAAAVVDESVSKESAIEVEEPVAAQDEPAPAEQVGRSSVLRCEAPQQQLRALTTSQRSACSVRRRHLRLWSSRRQKTTGLRCQTDAFGATELSFASEMEADCRLFAAHRDVADEDKAAVKQRKGAIASVVIDGASILAESLSQPVRRLLRLWFATRLLTSLLVQLSRHHTRVTARAITYPSPPAPRPPLPSLAYLNADLRPTDTLPSDASEIANPSKPSSEAPAPSKKQRRRPAQLKLQELRRPLSSLQDVSLLAVPLIAAEKEAKPVVKAVAPVKQVVKEKLKGNKRLSKERRELLRKKMGKNSKKNKRKKAKAKLKAQAVTA